MLLVITVGNLDQLDEFIKQKGLHYDVETAINVCRQAGFYEQGLFLAKQHGRHSAWLKLQLDQDKPSSAETGAGGGMEGTVALPEAHREEDCAVALDYIRNLPTAADAKSAMTKYGRVLLVELPEETTQFAIELCAGYMPPGASEPAEPDSNLEEYMDIFLGEKGRKQLTVFLERAKEQLEHSGVRLERQTTQKVNETLVELYLQTAQESAERADELHGKAMALLEDMESSKVDSDHALVLCHQYGFNDGELHLLSERPGMHRQILEKYMAIDDEERLIEAVQKFAQVSKNGETKNCVSKTRNFVFKMINVAQLDETLWVDVLRYYSQKGNAAAEQIQELLSLIEVESALPPLMVVEALASGPETSLEVCQDYLERQFASDFAVVHEDRKQSEKYKLDTAAAQKDMDDQLKAKARCVYDAPCAHSFVQTIRFCALLLCTGVGKVRPPMARWR